MRYLLTLFLVLPLMGFAQGVKSLNAYADYANQSAEELNSVFQSFNSYHGSLSGDRRWNAPRYVCPVQPDEYFYKKALGAAPPSTALLSQLKALHNAAESIDKTCKALDTYHKLEDFKSDDFAGARRMISELQTAFGQYAKQQQLLREGMAAAYSKAGATHPYEKVAADMRTELIRERAFLDLWTFNFNGALHTGWIVPELEKSILDTDAAVKRLKGLKRALKYPASSTWPSFVEALQSILDLKRRALNEYNFEARKSDKHRNDVYLSLINYYNGALLADYHNFINFSDRDGFVGLKMLRYVPVFIIADKAVEQSVTISRFEDLPRDRIKTSKQTTPIPKAVYSSLLSYVDLINETWRQVSHHRTVIRNLNSSASYVASLSSYAGRAPLSFQHDDFEVPSAHLQKAVSDSKALTPAHSAALNKGAQVLISILKEMDEVGAVLETEIAEKKYQQDKVKHVYELLSRTHELFRTWDQRKEELYEDIEAVYDSYPIADATASWNASGKALRQLARLDHDGLFKAKDFYNGKGEGPIETEAIQSTLREVIANEYDNMKGIEKYGRSNGRCPYTPYEDLPKSSKQLAEYLTELKPAKSDVDDYHHPYHSMVYIYNSIIDDYNKFCELSPKPLLPGIKQPELFILVPPRKAEETTPTQPQPQRINQPRNEVPAADPPKTKTETAGKSTSEKTRLIRDTVYIEKRDTVYLHDPTENLRSMEGYAVNNMVLLLDVSGSMNSADKLPLLKQSVMNMLSMMRQEDHISIVVFSGKPKVLLEAASFKDEKKIMKAIESLKPSGKTDGNAGLKLAYRVADDNYIRGGNNRIVLATDGEFPLSKDSEDLVRKFSSEDIFLTVFNFGKSGGGKSLERLATTGRGNYEFVSRDNAELKLIREAKAKRQK